MIVSAMGRNRKDVFPRSNKKHLVVADLSNESPVIGYLLESNALPKIGPR
jgi:hypothetical protein